MCLRYHFQYRDLLVLEGLFVRSEELVQAVPAYAELWIPKAHWVLHLAHDIFLYGPSRLLTTLLNEMKNAKFKAGAKRSNFHNPPKDVATFWAQQSDWELQTGTHRSACSATSADIIVSGQANTFAGSTAVSLLLQHECIAAETQVSFYSSIQFHGQPVRRTDYVLMDGAVYYLSRIIGVLDDYYLMLYQVAESVCMDSLGAYYIDAVDIGNTLPQRLVSVGYKCKVTSTWSFPADNRVYLVPRY